MSPLGLLLDVLRGLTALAGELFLDWLCGSAR